MSSGRSGDAYFAKARRGRQPRSRHPAGRPFCGVQGYPKLNSPRDQYGHRVTDESRSAMKPVVGLSVARRDARAMRQRRPTGAPSAGHVERQDRLVMGAMPDRRRGLKIGP